MSRAAACCQGLQVHMAVHCESNFSKCTSQLLNVLRTARRIVAAVQLVEVRLP